MRLVKNAPVLIVTKATETFETLIALKKVIQCRAIKIPVIANFKSPFLSMVKDFLLTKKYKAIKTEASNILNQTKGIASMVMRAPKIAVKPQIKTIKCRRR